MNILHLLWIVPLTSVFNFMFFAFCTMAKKGDNMNTFEVKGE